ncbi:MAG: DUF937 domain-containing protein [Cellulomonadaceae bacterium]|jgi:hypothetical protein|nr:DUF937 domain-containing protein [Cellulomonadaceae bacterium]
MTQISDLLKSLPIDQIASQLGANPDQVSSAAGSLLPALLGGLNANAQDPAGAASLTKALTQHSGSLIDGGIDPAAIDTADGAKIASNIFGANEDQVVAKVAQSTGNDQGLIAKLLPLLAPIVMSFIAKQMGGGGASQGASGGLGGLGAILSNVFGGGGGAKATPASTSAGGIDIGSVLGGILGGSSGGAASADGGLGDILGGLGGLLGGGKR